MDKYKLKKLDECTYVIEKTGNMKVPVKIFASKELLKKMEEDESVQQGVNVACLPGIYKQSVMLPDAHQGYGFPVGEVAAFDMEEGMISPGGVGYDINCGVRLLRTDLDRKTVEPKIHDLLENIFRRVPCGVGRSTKTKLNDEELDAVLNTGMKWAIKNGYATEDDFDKCEENGSMQTADASKISHHARERGRAQLGTLGAGNHFIEVQLIDNIFLPDIAERFGLKAKDQVTVMIHSGSRGLGHQVCADYLKKVEQEFPELLHALPDRELAYLPANSKVAKDYFGAMSAAANFAWVNRQMMTFQVRKAFKEVFGEKTELPLIYDVAHNMAKIEEHKINGEKKFVYVHRKGATRAFPPGHKKIPKEYRDIGQPILIPGSMGTASYVLVGTEKAMEETFGSTAHGAGRMLSRHAANRMYRGEKVKDELAKEKIYIRSASWKGISEEAPGAYKDVDEVARVSDVVGIGKRVARLRPLGVVKG